MQRLMKAPARCRRRIRALPAIVFSIIMLGCCLAGCGRQDGKDADAKNGKPDATGQPANIKQGQTAGGG